MQKSPLIIFVSLGIAVGCLILAKLGFWQLSRYQEKTNIIQQIDQNRQAGILDNTSIGQAVPIGDGQQIKLVGEFQNEYVFLLDNQILNGKVGYIVITPFMVTDGLWVLVNRGWIPLTNNRQVFPKIAPIIGTVTIEGFLQKAYRTPLNIEPLESDQISWPLRVQQIDTKMFSNILGVELFAKLVRLQDNCEYCYQMPPILPEGFAPERHLGYAVQWFALCFTLLAMYLYSIFRVKKAKDNA